MTTKKIHWRPNRRVDGPETRDNVDRAEAALEAIRFYMTQKGEKLDDAEYVETATDLVADILHYAASQQEDPARILRTAEWHFEEER